MKGFFTLTILLCSIHYGDAQSNSYEISSPDKNIKVSCDVAHAQYTVLYKNVMMIQSSKLGVIREDEDFSKNLQLMNVSAPTIVKDQYTMLTAKKKQISYLATQRVFETKTASG